MASSESDTESSQCSSGSGDDQAPIPSESKSKKFSPVILASLNAFFENGMVGVGEQYSSVLRRAALDTNLSTAQIKVRIDTNFVCIRSP